jgi:hypothetical protein
VSSPGLGGVASYLRVAGGRGIMGEPLSSSVLSLGLGRHLRIRERQGH